MINNELKFLPEYMGDLRKIEFIYAQHNDIDIDNLPDLEGCEHLQELHISNNFIKEIPERFCKKLPSLKVLDLRDNKIEKLPDEIAMLQSLMRLDLSNNSIYSLPTSLCTLAHLVSLQVEGNPIRSIRRDVIACGTQRILKTLRDRDGADGDAGSSQRNNQFNQIGSRVCKFWIIRLNHRKTFLTLNSLILAVEKQIQENDRNECQNGSRTASIEVRSRESCLSSPEDAG